MIGLLCLLSAIGMIGVVGSIIVYFTTERPILHCVLGLVGSSAFLLKAMLLGSVIGIAIWLILTLIAFAEVRAFVVGSGVDDEDLYN